MTQHRCGYNTRFVQINTQERTVSANVKCYRQQERNRVANKRKIYHSPVIIIEKVIRLHQLHATIISMNCRGLAIIGPSGSGKSSLGLELMAVGAKLVSDDRADLRREGDRIIASAPPQIAGMIEARGIGILRADVEKSVKLALIVDLGAEEVARLPPSRTYNLLGVALPLVLGPYRPHLYAALRQYLLAGKSG